MCFHYFLPSAAEVATTTGAADSSENEDHLREFQLEFLEYLVAFL